MESTVDYCTKALQTNDSVTVTVDKSSISQCVSVLLHFVIEFYMNMARVKIQRGWERKHVTLLMGYSIDNLADKCETTKQFHTVVLGGTFDHIHDGHRLLLSVAALLSSHRVVVGVASDCLLQAKKFAEHLEPLEKRMDNVRQFLFSFLGRNTRVVDIVSITDSVGPAGTDATMDCIVVSEETMKGADHSKLN